MFQLYSRLAILLTTSALLMACTTTAKNESTTSQAVVSKAETHRAMTEGSRHRTSLSAYLPTVLGEVKVVAVGDVMMHVDVVQASQDQPDGFEGLWAEAS